MHWIDDGIVLGARPHGESAVILELMTRARGRHLGLVHGGRSRRLRPVLQAGNLVRANWRARTDEQLGTFTVEAEEMRAARLFGSPVALYGLAALGSHLRLLPERDPHPVLFEALAALVAHLDHATLAPALFVRFELMLLAELGFGLDLAACAATGETRDLAYVSPKSGRAVVRAAGEPYRTRLLGLPPFLSDHPEAEAPPPDEIAAGFRLTGHFLDSRAYGPRGLGLPEERQRLLAALARPEAASATLDGKGPGDSPTAPRS